VHSTDTSIGDSQAAEQQAAAAVAELEERVRSGDDTVTPDALAAAANRSRWARLRREAADRKAERARREAEDRRRAETVQTVKARLDEHPLDELTARWQTAREALRALVAGIEDRNQAIKAAGHDLLSARFGRDDLPDRWHSTRVGMPGAAVRVDGEPYAPIVAGDVVLRLVADVAEQYGGLPRPYFDSVRHLIRGHVTPQRSPIEQR
jgi:hypothetical protein